MRILPQFYTDVEGGMWKPWTGGKFSVEYDLFTHPRKEINGVTVNSLLFGSFELDAQSPRWDKDNGWTTDGEFEQKCKQSKREYDDIGNRVG